jgi:hypothetical protein
MHATIKQELDPKIVYPNHAAPPRHTSELNIWRNTSLATISSLLRYPLIWKFVDGQLSRSPVLGVSSAYVNGPATLTHGQPDRHGFFTPISGNIRRIFVWKLEGNEWEQARRESSIGALSRFSSPDVSPENITPDSHRLDIQCDEPEDTQAWLREVRWLE